MSSVHHNKIFFDVRTASPQAKQAVEKELEHQDLTNEGQKAQQHQHYRYNPYDTQCSHQAVDAFHYSCAETVMAPVDQEGYIYDQHYGDDACPNTSTADQCEDQYHHGQQQHQQYYPNGDGWGWENEVAADQHDPHRSMVAHHHQQQQLPLGTLHSQLRPYVAFIPYPTEEFVNPNKSRCHAPSDNSTMSRVFLGQLPYQVTDMQLDWLCYTFGNGGAVHFPERITKHDPMRGCKMPTGCIHAYVENHHAAAMLNALHKHILVDDTGVWFAENADQQAVLNDYCLMMKNDKTKRYQNRPYDTVVAQFATSSYVRRR